MTKDLVGIREILSELIERVESGTGADRALEVAICCAVLDAAKQKGWWNFQAMRARDTAERPAAEYWNKYGAALTTSIDSVVSLIGQKLPLAEWELTTTGFKPGATVIPNGSKHGGAYASSPARALLAACLRAIQAQAQNRADATKESPEVKT